MLTYLILIVFDVEGCYLFRNGFYTQCTLKLSHYSQHMPQIDRNINMFV